MNNFWILAAAVDAAEKEMSGVLKFLLENPFAIGLTLLFLAAVVGAFVAARKSDRCLKKFRHFSVTIERQDGRRIWGALKVFSKGLELLYREPYDRPAKNSFLLYEGDLGKVLALYRFADRLEGANRARRERQSARLADPPLASRVWRWMRNIVNTFRDAIVQALGMSVQQASKASPGAPWATGGTQIAGIGATIVGATANAYEPMLEQYIGKPVILELVNPADAEKRHMEYHGYLGEYSAQFILLVDVRHRFQEKVPLAGGEMRLAEDRVLLRPGDRRLMVENHSAAEIIVEGIHAGEHSHEMNVTVAAGETRQVPLPEAAQAEGAQVAVSVERLFDMIVPRACGIVRHASEAGGG